MMNRAVLPLASLLVPGTVVVIAAPIRVERESQDRNAEPGRVRVQGDVATLVLVRDIRRVKPAAVAVETDVTPTPIIETPHYLDGRVRVELRYFGIRAVRTGIDTRGIAGHRVLRGGHGHQGYQARASRQAPTSRCFHGTTLQIFLCSIERAVGSKVPRGGGFADDVADATAVTIIVEVRFGVGRYARRYGGGQLAVQKRCGRERNRHEHGGNPPSEVERDARFVLGLAQSPSPGSKGA